VFRFTGRDWRPNRRVTATFGVYCRPGEVCIAIAYLVRPRTDERGRFAFRLRAGQERPRDDERGIRSGSAPTFSQRIGKPGDGRFVSRMPRWEDHTD
jgi:hypothetical protein